jgi:WS/DGAT/MGAT family acyltransferase
MVAAALDDFRAIRRALGGRLGVTVNDVVVAVAADAVGRLLRWRGHDTTDLDLRVMVPVRVADADPPGAAQGIGEARTVGDGVVGVLAPLPVLRMDPVARLYRVTGEMAGLKESRQAVAAEALVRLAGFAPPNLHAAAARLVSAEQRYSLALSNAPGPQAPRYLAGSRMEENYPFLPLAGDSALSIAVNSYAGGVYVGLVGERDALPDLDLLAGFFTEALEELRAAAARARR